MRAMDGLLASVFHNGKGRNSVAMAVGFKQRGFRPTLILSADTMGEKAATYRYQADVFYPWLAANGFPDPVEVSKGSLEQECLDKQTLPSIVVGFKSCSDHYKIRPQNRYIQNWEPAIAAWNRGEKVVKFVGFDAGEAHRIYNADDKRYEVRYPLVEWGWDRERCEQEILAEGLPLPPKSSCFFCPNMREREILALKREEPELFERALAMERNNTKLVTIKGLARSISWAQIGEYEEAQLPLLPPTQMPCACVDGEL